MRKILAVMDDSFKWALSCRRMEVIMRQCSWINMQLDQEEVILIENASIIFQPTSDRADDWLD